MDIQPTINPPTDAGGSEDRGDLHREGGILAGKVVGAQKTYTINEVFYSLQGEGIRAGTANVFVRFSGCNQTCKVETHGFDCDTEFVSGRKLTLDELHTLIVKIGGLACKWLILTGGEPALQVDEEFCLYFRSKGYKLAIETNGSIFLPHREGPPNTWSYHFFDWITVSPKVAEHVIRQRTADEVKYVRGYGQGIPKTVVEAQYYLISPAFNGTELDRETLQWCVKLVLENPKWRLSIQQHKTTFGGVR